MIRYFPTPYPDELLYSLLSRYYAKSSYLAYTYAAEELFVSKTVRPEIEFVNLFTSDALRMITKNMTMEDVVLHHTMFPYYGRFLSYERRQRAFQSLVSMQGNYHNLLPMPKKKDNSIRCLRYCPMCAEIDRRKYGETFWHRTHQMIGLAACPVHGCYLVDSNVIIGGNMPPTLKSAEEVIPTLEAVTMANEIERRLVVYMSEVFQANVDMKSDVAVGQFLHPRMENTKYRSVRGEQRNIKLFHSDFTEFYHDLHDNRFTELWQIQKVLTNDRINFNEICLLALFMNIPASELCNMKISEKSQQQLFDEEVYRLHNQGLKYPEIAKRLNASYNVVKAVGGRRYGTYQKPAKIPMKSGAKVQDWQKIDEDTLPLVRSAIKQLQGDGTTRPKKVTVFAVERRLNLPAKRISLHLPKCLAEVKKHEETQEQYWAREVVWAVMCLDRTGIPLVWRRVRELTNLRRRDFETCLPFVGWYSEHGVVERILRLLDGC